MKNVMKFVFGLVFSLGFLISANAQTDSAEGSVPSPDDIVCVQVAENVFECAVTDPNFGQQQEEDYQQDQGTDQESPDMNRDSDIFNEDTENQDMEDPSLNETESDFYHEDSLSGEEFELNQEDNASGQDQEIFREGTTEEEKKSQCERILDENQSQGNEPMDQQLYEEGDTESDQGIYEEGSTEQDVEIEEEGSELDQEIQQEMEIQPQNPEEC